MAIIHILDKQTDSIIGTLNTEKGDVNEPIRTSSLNNENTFDMTAFKKFDILSKRNRLLVPDRDGFYHEYIIFYASQYERNEKKVKADASFVDLAKAKVIDPQTLQGATSQTVTDLALLGTEWQAGEIEYTFIRTIEIEKHTDPYSLLKLIASTFELEIRFRIEISGNKVTRFVDMKKQISGFEGKEIVFGKDLIGIEREEDGSKIVTALLGIGPVQEDGTQLTVFVEDNEALQRWGRKKVEENGNYSLQHLIEPYEPQTDNLEMTLERLTTLTQVELKKRIDAIVTYKCTAASLEHIFGHSHEKIRLGQTVRIKDDGYTPPLYVEARIQKTTENVALQRTINFEIGNFIEFKKEDLEAQIAGLKKIINDRIANMILNTISSSAGNTFKNGLGSTTLTAKVFLVGGAETDLEGARYSYKWIKKDKDGNEVSGYSKTTKFITVNADEITEKATFVCEVSTDKALQVAQVTLFNVYDGQEGQPGEPGGKGETGDNAISAVLTSEAHAVPTDSEGNNGDFSDATTSLAIYEGTTDVTSSWAITQSRSNVMVTELTTSKSATVTAMSADSGYVEFTATRNGFSTIKKRFTLVKNKQGDKGEQGEKGEPGKEGIAYMGPTAPSNPALNATWFKTDLNEKVIAIFKWSGTAWVETKMLADVFSVAKLSALSADLGDVTTGKLTGVTMSLVGGKFIVDSDGVSLKQGAITIERPDGYKSIDDGIIKHGFNVFPATPPFQTAGVTTQGPWWRVVTNNRYENVQMFTFRHDSRYMIARVGIYSDGAFTANMAFDLDISGGDGTSTQTLAIVTRNGFDDGWTTTITMDLGVPDGTIKTLYVRLWGPAEWAVFGRILYLVQEG